MNKEMKKQLEAVINSIVNEDSDAATASFHTYLQAKTQSILLGEKEECDEDDMDDKDEDEDDKPAFLKKKSKSKKDDSDEDEDEDEDEDDEQEKPTKGKKGVNPFAKKAKKDKDDE